MPPQRTIDMPNASDVTASDLVIEPTTVADTVDCSCACSLSRAIAERIPYAPNYAHNCKQRKKRKNKSSCISIIQDKSPRASLCNKPELDMLEHMVKRFWIELTVRSLEDFSGVCEDCRIILLHERDRTPAESVEDTRRREE